MGVRYRIGEFARLSGVSAKTLRFYDAIGILRPASIDPRTRYRFYVPRQLEELAGIVALKELGAPLAEVRRLANSDGPLARKEALEELKERLERSIQTATQSLRWIGAELEEEEASRHRRSVPVVVKRRPAVAIASVRSKIKSYEEIEVLVRELEQELPKESMASLHGVLWHSCADSGQLEGEAFFALRAPVRKRSVYEVKELPAAALACAYSALDDTSAERSYDAIRRWMQVRGYRLAGPKRELLLGPMLEIQFPMEA